MNISDLDVLSNFTGEEILELIFGEATKYLTDKNVPVKHQKTVDTAKNFIEWMTSFYDGGALFIIKTPSFSGRGISWFKKCKFDKDAFFKLLKTKEIASKLEGRGIKIKKGFMEAIEKSLSKNKKIENSCPVPTITRGRPKSPVEPLVIEKALKIRKQRGTTSAPEIARMAQITTLLAKDASHMGLKSISDDEYKKRFGRTPGTVANWIRQGFKKNPPS